MAEDASATTSKILLRHAENKSKAKSWLTASLGSNTEETPDLNLSSSLSQEPDHDLASLEYGDENSGIGSARRADEGELSTNRQVLSANEALRRRLLSKDAYKKYSSGQNKASIGSGKSKMLSHRSSTKKKSLDHDDDDDDEEEIKGRSSLGRSQRQKTQQQQQNQNIAAVIESEGNPDSVSRQATPTPTPNPNAIDHTISAVQQSDVKVVSTGMRKRARPGSSYLDQVLSKRHQKKQKGR